MDNKEIDKQIAVKIMGSVIIENECGIYFQEGESMRHCHYFRPSTNIHNAFEVVEKMQENDFWFSLSYKTERVVKNEMPPEWWARFRCIRGGTRTEGYSSADTPAIAICFAALKTKESANA